MSAVTGATSTPQYNQVTSATKKEEVKQATAVFTEETAKLLEDVKNQDEKYKPHQKGLGQDGYFKLLMTQLQHQDPTSPMDNTEMIAQMAQFSVVEQTASTSEGIQKLLAIMTEGSSSNTAMNESLDKILVQLESLNESIDKETGLIQELINTNKANAAYSS